jgi:hypothetical protein
MASRVTRLLPFVYSADIAYVVELGNEYARFFYDGEVLENDSSQEVWIRTPYAVADLYDLHYRQRGDQLWITHKRYPTMILSRTTPTTFLLDEALFRNGPFLLRNDLIDPDNPSTTTLACSSTLAGAGGTLTATAEVFLPGHVGALFQICHATVTTIVSKSGPGPTPSAALPIKGSWSFYTHGTWTGTVTVQRQENGGEWESFRTYKGKGDRNVQLALTETADNVQFRILPSDAMSAAFEGEISTDTVITKGSVRIEAVTNPFLATCTVMTALESTAATIKWAEGAWSGVRGYPATMTFYEDRAVFAGASLPLDDTEYSTSAYPAFRA